MFKLKIKNEKLKIIITNSKFLILNFGFAFLILNFIFLCGCNNQHLHKDTQVMLGTFVEVISPDKNAAAVAFNEIRRIEGLLSKYKGDSEVSRLNKLGKLKVSPETFYVISKAKGFYEASRGAFDITVGPLVDLWGFTDKKFSVPSDEQIKNTLGLIGSDKIILHNSGNVIEFKLSGMKIDLGGIAKGYALDCAIEKLKAAGVKSCLINAGGQVRSLGYKFHQPWVVAVKNPRAKDFVDYLMLLPDKSASTSGDYEQYFIKDNKCYSHILNPKTGYPAESGILSVTVIAPSGLDADTLSTSIFVLGKEKGEALAKRFPEVQVKIIEKGIR